MVKVSRPYMARNQQQGSKLRYLLWQGISTNGQRFEIICGKELTLTVRGSRPFMTRNHHQGAKVRDKTERGEWLALEFPAMKSRSLACTICQVFGMTRPGIEP